MGSTSRTRTAALLAGTAVLLLTLAPAAPSGAAPATKKTPTPSVSAQLKQQKEEIESQRAQIEGQKARIERQIAHADSQAVQIEGLQAKLDSLNTRVELLTQRLEDLEVQAGKALPDSVLEQRLERVEAAAKKAPELPPDVVSAGDFPGSMRVPGTDAAIKFGGRVRTAAVFTLDPLGTDDRFLTNSIPVGVSSTSGEDKRTNISARASRLNTEFRTPIGAQEVRAYFEGDFAGTGNTFRLRHAYAQFQGFLVGQTWSTFSDPAAAPEDIDFEGISSENVIRQPLMRYWWYADSLTRMAVAIETPSVSLTGGTGVNLLPDIIVRAVRGHPEGGHLQLAGVLRQIRGEATPGDVRMDWGYGLSVSGSHPFRIKGLEDRVVYQINGGVGIARYINDLNSLGGQDAVFDSTTGDLKALPAIGWYIAYEHRWKEWEKGENMNLRSTLLWSFVDVDNFDFQAPDAYNKTHRFAANLIFSPATRVDVGVEYIYGFRENKNNEHGSANQVQLVTIIRF